MGAPGRARAGLIVAAVAVALVAAPPGAATPAERPAAPPDDPATATVAPHDPAAAGAFVAAWERSLAGSFAVTSTAERRLPDGRRVTSRSVLVQRPPDRLLRRDAAVAGRLGGRRVACSAVGTTVVACTDGGPAAPYPDEAGAEVAAVASAVTGAEPPYAVTTDGDGCFRLRLRVWSPAPAFGTAARFCFDGATGAPVLTEVTRPEGVDRTAAVEVRPVRRADLTLPG